MKKILSFLLTAFAVFTANAQEDCFRLSGKLAETGDTVVMYVEEIDGSSSQQQQSMVVCENAFETTLDINRPTAIALYNKIGEALSNQPILLIALPNEHCVITGSWSDCKYEGSQFYDDFNRLVDLSKSAQKNAVALVEEFQARVSAGEDANAIVAEYRPKIEEIYENLARDREAFIRSNADNDVAAVFFLNMDIEKRLELYPVLSDKVKNGKMKPLLDFVMDESRKEMEKKEQAKAIQEGMPAPDFTLDDIDGKPLALSQLRGKYVVIDFWGSWCVWCIKGMPKMKEYYEKYAGKLEILGVDCGDSQEKWKEAVAEHQLPWKHVYNSEEKDITVTYGISGFPTKIVVDPQGNIAKVVVGEDPAFYEFLDELLK